MAVAELLLRLGVDVSGLASDFDNAVKEGDKAAREFEKSFKGLDAVAGRMNEIGTKMLGVTAAIVGVGAGAVGAALQVEEGMDKIRAGTGATGAELDALGEIMRNVARGVPQSIGEVSTAIADLSTRTGATGPQLEALARASLDLSRITGESLGPIIASTTRVFGDWGVEMGEQVDTLDYLFRTSQATGIGVGELSEKVVQFGAPLRQLGFDLDTAAALLGQFEREGVNTEVVLNSLRLALGKMAREGVTDAGEAFELLVEQIKNAGTASEANTLALEVFGSRAGVDMAAAIREGRFEIGELVTQLRNSPESIDRAAKATRSFSDKLGTLKNNAILAIEPLGTRLLGAFDAMLPAITSVIGVVASVAEAFANLPGPVQTAILGFAAAVAAIGPLLIIGGQLITAFLSIKAALAALTPLFAIGLIPALKLLAVVVGAVVAVWAAWEFAKWLSQTALVQAAVKGIVSAFETLLDWASKIPGVSSIIAGMREATDKAKDAFDRTTGAAGATATEAGKVGTEAGKAATSINNISSAALSAQPRMASLASSSDAAAEAAKRAEEESRKYTEALKTLGLDADGSKDKLGNMASAVDTVKAAVQAGKAPLDDLTAAQQAYRRAIDETDVAQLDRALKNIGVTKRDTVKEIKDLNWDMEILKANFDAGRINVDTYNTALEAHKRKVFDLLTPVAELAEEQKKVEAAFKASGDAAKTMVEVQGTIPPVIQGITMANIDLIDKQAQAAAGTIDVREAFKSLGIEMDALPAQERINRITSAFETIKNSGIATPQQIQAAYEKMQKDVADILKSEGPGSIIGASNAAKIVMQGHWSDFAAKATDHVRGLQRSAVDALFSDDKADSFLKAGKIGLGALVKEFGDFASKANDAGLKTASSLIQALWEGEKSWAGIGKSILSSLLTSFIDWGASLVSEAGLIASGLQKVWDSVKGIIPGLSGAASSVAGGAATTGGTVAAPAGGGAASTAGGIGGIAGAVDVVSGVVSAVSNVISNFQQMGMNKTLDLIETETRETKTILRDILDPYVNTYIPKLDGIHNFLHHMIMEGIRISEMPQLDLGPLERGIASLLQATGLVADTGFDQRLDMAQHQADLLDKLDALFGSSDRVAASNLYQEELLGQLIERTGVDLSPVAKAVDGLGEKLAGMGTVIGEALAPLEKFDALRQGFVSVETAIVGQLSLVYDVLAQHISGYLMEIRDAQLHAQTWFRRANEQYEARQRSGIVVEGDININGENGRELLDALAAELRLRGALA